MKTIPFAVAGFILVTRGLRLRSAWVVGLAFGLGFELVLTHWFYLYLPWFFPFVSFALLAPALQAAREPVEETAERETPALATARV